MALTRVLRAALVFAALSALSFAQDGAREDAVALALPANGLKAPNNNNNNNNNNANPAGFAAASSTPATAPTASAGNNNARGGTPTPPAAAPAKPTPAPVANPNAGNAAPVASSAPPAAAVSAPPAPAASAAPAAPQPTAQPVVVTSAPPPAPPPPPPPPVDQGTCYELENEAVVFTCSNAQEVPTVANSQCQLLPSDYSVLTNNGRNYIQVMGGSDLAKCPELPKPPGGAVKPVGLARVADAQCAVARGGYPLMIGCANGRVISDVISAYYGTPDSDKCGSHRPGGCNSDLRKFVTIKCEHETTCSILATRAVLGTDPCPQLAKTLAVQYTCGERGGGDKNGKNNNKNDKNDKNDDNKNDNNNDGQKRGRRATAPVCGGPAKKGGQVTLTCPTAGDVITKVDFAAYGDVKGTCGTFSRGTCSSAKTQGEVERLCLQKTTCTVPSDNALFGDPCKDVDNHLAVQVTCARQTPTPPAPAGPTTAAAPNPAAPPPGSPTTPAQAPPPAPPVPAGSKCVMAPANRMPRKTTCPALDTTVPEKPEDPYIVVGGTRFAVIDNTLPSTSVARGTCKVGWRFSVPEGWVLAVDGPYTQLAMMMRTWGINYVTLANGNAYRTLSTDRRPVATGALLGDAVTGYYPKDCSYRILISQPARPGDAELVVLSKKPVSNIVTYNGIQYAAIDDTPVNATGFLCQKTANTLPAGWTLAEDSSDMRVALLGMGRAFGTLCKVTGGGTSFMYNNDNCGDNALQKYELPKQVGGQTVYWPVSCSRRVFIQRKAPANAVASTSRSTAITNVVITGGLVYATLDNADPSGVASANGCQSSAFRLPSGWELADPNSETTKAVIKEHNFGVWCLLGRNGIGMKTGTAQGQCGTDEILRVNAEYRGNVWVGKYTNCSTCGPIQGPPVLDPKPFFDSNVTWTASQGVAQQQWLAVKFCNKRILMALLLTTQLNSTSLPYLEDIMKKNGAPYEVVETIGLESLSLVDENNQPRYFGIFLTDAFLSYQDEQGVWKSSLSAPLWSQLNNYCARFGVRRVSAFTFPSSTVGVELTKPGVSEPFWLHPSSGGPLKLEKVQLRGGMVWHASARLLGTPQNGMTVTPVLIYGTDEKQPATSDNVGGVLLRTSAGAQELHFFFASSTSVPLGLPVGNMWFSWAAEGVEPPEDNSKRTALIVGIVLGALGGIAMLSILFCTLRRRGFCRCWGSRGLDFEVEKWDRDKWEGAQHA